MFVSNPDINLCGWLCSKHQLTKYCHNTSNTGGREFETALPFTVFYCMWYSYVGQHHWPQQLIKSPCGAYLLFSISGDNRWKHSFIFVGHHHFLSWKSIVWLYCFGYIYVNERLLTFFYDSTSCSGLRWGWGFRVCLNQLVHVSISPGFVWILSSMVLKLSQPNLLQLCIDVSQNLTTWARISREKCRLLSARSNLCWQFKSTKNDCSNFSEPLNLLQLSLVQWCNCYFIDL